MNPVVLLVECLGSLAQHARRIAPMAAGIVWGVASVFVLVAIGRGFESTQRASLEALGDSFMLLRVNRASETRGDTRADGFVLLDAEDMELARAGTPSLDTLSPKAHNWFLQVARDGDLARATAVGVDPSYADIVHVPLLPGSRWFDERDMQQELPVCVIGTRVQEELFPDGDWHGAEIQVVFERRAGEDTVVRRLTVVGALDDEPLAGDDVYTSQRRVVFLPFPTWDRMSQDGFQFMVVRPRRPELRDQALAELRLALSRRHDIDPDNENTLLPYFDAIERGARIEGVFGGIEIFLGAVGALIMLLGAVGVANVVLMSVTARTSEFGLRRALGCKRRWIFAQVFLEAALICVVSGVLGFLLGMGGTVIMGSVDLPEGFAAPEADLGAAVLPGLLLLVVSVGAALWPALRASRVQVATALHGSHA